MSTSEEAYVARIEAQLAAGIPVTKKALERYRQLKAKGVKAGKAVVARTSKSGKRVIWRVSGGKVEKSLSSGRYTHTPDRYASWVNQRLSQIEAKLNAGAKLTPTEKVFYEQYTGRRIPESAVAFPSREAIQAAVSGKPYYVVTYEHKGLKTRVVLSGSEKQKLEAIQEKLKSGQALTVAEQNFLQRKLGIKYTPPTSETQVTVNIPSAKDIFKQAEKQGLKPGDNEIMVGFSAWSGKPGDMGGYYVAIQQLPTSKKKEQGVKEGGKGKISLESLFPKEFVLFEYKGKPRKIRTVATTKEGEKEYETTYQTGYRISLQVKQKKQKPEVSGEEVIFGFISLPAGLLLGKSGHVWDYAYTSTKALYEKVRYGRVKEETVKRYVESVGKLGKDVLGIGKAVEEKKPGRVAGKLVESFGAEVAATYLAGGIFAKAGKVAYGVSKWAGRGFVATSTAYATYDIGRGLARAKQKGTLGESLFKLGLTMPIFAAGASGISAKSAKPSVKKGRVGLRITGKAKATKEQVSEIVVSKVGEDRYLVWGKKKTLFGWKTYAKEIVRTEKGWKARKPSKPLTVSEPSERIPKVMKGKGRAKAKTEIYEFSLGEVHIRRIEIEKGFLGRKKVRMTDIYEGRRSTTIIKEGRKIEQVSYPERMRFLKQKIQVSGEKKAPRTLVEEMLKMETTQPYGKKYEIYVARLRKKGSRFYRELAKMEWEERGFGRELGKGKSKPSGGQGITDLGKTKKTGTKGMKDIGKTKEVKSGKGSRLLLREKPKETGKVSKSSKVRDIIRPTSEGGKLPEAKGARGFPSFKGFLKFPKRPFIPPAFKPVQPRPAIEPMSRIKPGISITPNIRHKPIITPVLKPKFDISLKPKSTPDVTPLIVPVVIPRITPRLTPRLTPRITPVTTTTLLPRIPAPPRTPPRLRIPPPPLPPSLSGGGSIRLPRISLLRRPRAKYRPSLIAQLRKIKARKKKKVLTGWEIRPILR